VEANVALWSYVLPLLGVFKLVKFKKGGPYGLEGTYISNSMAICFLLMKALFSHFVLSQMIRAFIESNYGVYSYNDCSNRYVEAYIKEQRKGIAISSSVNYFAKIFKIIFPNFTEKAKWFGWSLRSPDT
jgi:hypothetical protein